MALTALIVQTAAVLIALVAVIVALQNGQKDRRASDARAEEDRRAAREEAQRRFDLDMLVRLSINFEMGGGPTAEESRRSGAEAGALLSALGPERLPLSWSMMRKGSLEEAARFNSENHDQESAWRRRANEVALELDRVRRG